MKVYTMQLAGVTYRLRFDMAAWERLEEEVCMLDELGDRLTERGHLATLTQVFAILSGSDGAAVRAAMQPAHVRPMTAAVWQAISEGMKLQETETDEEEEIDVTLQELEKKTATGA